MSKSRKIEGKVHSHFLTRIKNYNFPGSSDEAKKIGKAFFKLADGPNDWVAVSIKNLDRTSLSSELYRKTEKMIVENQKKDKELFIKVQFGRIVNILEARLEKKQKQEVPGIYIHLLH